MPPSAIAGMPCSRQAAAVSSTAVNCGTPTPATTRVVQMLPGPMPIFTASAPASISARAPSGVATLPAITCTALDCVLIASTARSTPGGMAVRGIDHDDVDPGRDQRARAVDARPRRRRSPRRTRSRPSSSLLASGCACALSMSLTVISPTQR